MNLQQQLLNELDRIISIMPGLLFDKYNDFHNESKEITERYGNPPIERVIAHKREVIASIFKAKDENGEYVLREGSLENPNYKTREEKHYSGAMLTFANSEQSTLRDLYFANCFGRTQEEIENLKLIKW